MKIIKVINKNGVYCTPKLDITISEWKEMLLNEDIFDNNSIIMLKRWYQEPNHAASGKTITNKYNPGLKNTPYNGIVKGLGLRILNYLNRYELERSNDSSNCRWAIVFNGWYEGTSFVWQIKEDLVCALEETHIIDIDNPLNETQLSFLYKYDYWFNEKKKEILQNEKNVLKLHDEFLKKYPAGNLKDIKINDYAIGLQNNDSFCYQVETILHDLGDIRGAQLTASQRFGVYFDSNTNSYSIGNVKKFGNDYNIAFKNVKKSLVDLVDAIKNKDYESIAVNPLNPLFKNKLTYIYDSDNWVPIYSDKDLDIILSILGIPFDQKKDRVFKRLELFRFYKSLKRDDISLLRFMKFIYNDLGYRSYLRDKEIQSVSDIINVNDYKLIDIKSIKEKQTSKKISRTGLIVEKPESIIQKKVTGKRGEEIVKEYLLKHKEELGIVGDIDFACDYDDYKHYDISYENKNNEIIYIEVKSTKANNADDLIFEMSSAEYDFMMEHKDNYYIYFINDVNNGKIIKRLSANLIIAKPSKYSVALTTK